MNEIPVDIWIAIVQHVPFGRYIDALFLSCVCKKFTTLLAWFRRVHCIVMRTHETIRRPDLHGVISRSYGRKSIKQRYRCRVLAETQIEYPDGRTKHTYYHFWTTEAVGITLSMTITRPAGQKTMHLEVISSNQIVILDSNKIVDSAAQTIASAVRDIEGMSRGGLIINEEDSRRFIASCEDIAWKES